MVKKENNSLTTLCIKINMETNKIYAVFRKLAYHELYVKKLERLIGTSGVICKHDMRHATLLNNTNLNSCKVITGYF